MATRLILLLMLGACAADTPSPAADEERSPRVSAVTAQPMGVSRPPSQSFRRAIFLPGTRWTVTEVNGRATPGGPSYHVSFDRFQRGQITAGFGCNSFQGGYRVNGDHLGTSDLIGTEMACGEPAATLERLGVLVLGSNMRIERLQEGHVRLVSEAGTIDLRPASAPPVEPGGESYRARGQEPGWALTIAGGQIDYQGNYGEKRIRVVAPEPINGINGHIYETERLSVHITHRRCNDAMSGHGYTDTVMVIADGETYRGCGGERRMDWDN